MLRNPGGWRKSSRPAGREPRAELRRCGIVAAVESLLRLIGLLIAGYVVVCGLLYLVQDNLIFLTRPLLFPPTGDHVRDVSIERGDVTLRGWIVNPDSAGPLVIYFGGNAEELSTAVPVFARLEAATVLINYRGYGTSEGAPSAAKLIDDARAIVRVMKERLGDGRRLVLFGRSLGSGIALHASQAVDADALILMSPYLSLQRLAKRVVPFVPVGWLLKHEIDATRALDRLPPQVLVMYGDPDHVIPTEESRAFVRLLEPPPQVIEFDGDHNVPLTQPELWGHVEAFIEG